MLTPAPKGVSQEPNLAEIREFVKHRKHGNLDDNEKEIHNVTYAIVSAHGAHETLRMQIWQHM